MRGEVEMDKTADNKDDQIMRLIFSDAVGYATLRLAFRGEKAWMKSKSVYEEIKDLFINICMNTMIGKYENQEDYDKVLLETSQEICNYYNNSSRIGNTKFTFGNAQKMLNIMMKYLYIWSLGDEDRKECFKYCHCPMDQRMLEFVWSRRGELDKQLRDKFGKREEFLKSWGDEDYENDDTFPQRYDLFQEAVRMLCEDGESPLEFDYRNWK